MEGQKSFKERVKEAVIHNAVSYKWCYLDYEYLLCSKAFTKSEYYIVSAHEDNYLHLTGLHTNLNAEDFFYKCLNGTLEESDFDFIKPGQNEKEVRGSVRRKISSLPGMMNMFAGSSMVEEDFGKNRIRCSFATTSSYATLGFIVVGKARPMTLLKGNELDSAKAKRLELVLRRKRGEDKFSELLVGTKEILSDYKEKLVGLLTDELRVNE